MNNGQPSRISDKPDSFASGVNRETNMDMPKLENNPDFSEPTLAWDQTPSGSLDNNPAEKIPKRSPEDNIANNLSETREEKPGQVEHIEQMPGIMPPAIGEKEELNPAMVAKNSLDHAVIKTTDQLSQEGVKAVDDIIAKFRTNGEDAATFYDAARDAMEENLDNSYNRKLQS